MLEVNEIINKLARGEVLTEQERFKIINFKSVPSKVLEYLANRFQNFTIEVCDDYKGNILELMQKGILEGWCWQTTESAIVLLNDDDYIERGNLIFDKYQEYFHSWICFKFEEEEYVFDPCLDLLCPKSIYTQIFETVVEGRVTAKEVRDVLIKYLLDPNSPRRYNDLFWQDFFKEDYDFKRKEVQISGDDDVTSPMFRNHTGYNATLEDGKIRKLTAHYYVNA